MDGENGLICAYVLNGEGGGASLDWDGVANWRPQQGALWVHLDHTFEDARHWVQQSSGLDEAVASTLLARETRPRSLDLAHGFLVALRGVNLNPGQDPEDMVALRVWVEPNRIVTTRHRKLAAVGDLRALIAKGEGPVDSSALFTKLTGLLADRVEPVLARLSEEISQIEDELTRAERRALHQPRSRPRLGELQRDAIALRRYLAPQGKALAAFDDDGFGFLDEVHRMNLRDIEDRITRHVEDLTSEIERAATLNDHITNDLSDQMNRTVYILSLIAAVFLPLGFVTDLFGTNLTGLPDHPFGFELLLGGLISVAIVILLVFRRLRWL